MAHSYAITSNTAVGDQATLVGTVDGIPVTVNYWVSALTSLTEDQQKAYLASLMDAQVFPPQPSSVSLPATAFTL
jgi:hypothetical protein